MAVSNSTVSRTGESPLKRPRVLVFAAELGPWSAAKFRIDFADDFLPEPTLAFCFHALIRLYRNPPIFAHPTQFRADRNSGSLP